MKRLRDPATAALVAPVVVAFAAGLARPALAEPAAPSAATAAAATAAATTPASADAAANKPGAKKKAGVDCRRVAGRMQIRILELRGGGPSRGPSALAQGLQQGSVPLFGGTARGMDAAGERAADLAKLEADNALLKAEKCPHYDLAAELAKPVTGPTPKLIRPAKPK